MREGLGAVERAITGSQNLPILKNVLLETRNNKIKLAATNLELGITKFISGKIIEEGATTVPFDVFSSIVAHVDSERVELSTKDATLFFKTDNYEAKIQGIDVREFPIIPAIGDKEHYIEMDGEVLAGAVEQIAAAAHPSEIRPEISGVLFDYQLTLFKTVATDTFRLGEKIVSEPQFKGTFEKGFRAIIPLHAAHELLRIFSRKETIRVFFDSNQVLFENNDTQLISRLIDGEYPDYEAIIPSQHATTLVLERDRFIAALRLVSSFSGKINEVKFKLREGKTLEIYSASQYVGENNYLIPVKSNGTKFDDITFNWRYLLDGLKSAVGEQIQMGITDAAHPVLLMSPDDHSYRYVLMPIKA